MPQPPFRPRPEDDQAPPPPPGGLVPRGPPRKPKQSGYALWVGNLPPSTTVLHLRDMFAAPEIESVFLISKSNCAFVNYSSEAAVRAALDQFRAGGGVLNGTKLVARLQRGSSAERAEQHRDDDDPDDSRGTARSPSPSDCSPDTTAASSAPSAAPVPDKFFIIKSLTTEDLELSVDTGSWATQTHNEAALDAAFRAADNVYLIFSANKSGEYFGYARMESGIAAAPPDDRPPAGAPAPAPEPDDADSRPTEATALVPAGRIVDDSTRGTIFWEVLPSEPPSPVLAPDAAPPSPPAASWGTPFRIQWLSTTKVPFYRTRGLKNPWNANRDIKIARDGTELEPGVGKRLIALFHPAAAAAAPGLLSVPLGLAAPSMIPVAGTPLGTPLSSPLGSPLGALEPPEPAEAGAGPAPAASPATDEPIVVSS
ncbi:YT521-B-like domain-containing protein [Dipodascopsis tothii]|uniref:YT521-B-like domain-containing protein n=1 Tax=Dipodascopsis tothii TaxID=44089 RepID=UPI0034CDC365